jgi:hypothetical protein
MSDRGPAFAHLARGRRVERVLLALHRPAGSCVRERAIALRHEPAYPDRLPGREQMIGALDPQPVGQREIAIEVTQVQRRWNRGQLMDDHLRPCRRHGLGDLLGIKRVRDHRHSAQLVEHRLL